MREGPYSGAVAPKHRLVLETALLLQCHLCISQDAWVSMETAADQATAVLVPSPSWGCGLGLLLLALPHPLQCRRPSQAGFSLAFVSSLAVPMGVVRVCPAGVQA